MNKSYVDACNMLDAIEDLTANCTLEQKASIAYSLRCLAGYVDTEITRGVVEREQTLCCDWIIGKRRELVQP